MRLRLHESASHLRPHTELMHQKRVSLFHRSELAAELDVLSIVKAVPSTMPLMVLASCHRRAIPTHLPRATISVTLGALLSRLVRPIRERIWWYVRVGAVGWPVFEHCAVVLTPPGGGTIAHSPI